MRGGRFLAEESPSELIRRYHADSLEDVFLKLSVLQNRGKRRRSSILADVVEKVELPAMSVSILPWTTFYHLPHFCRKYICLSNTYLTNATINESMDEWMDGEKTVPCVFVASSIILFTKKIRLRILLSPSPIYARYVAQGLTWKSAPQPPLAASKCWRCALLTAKCTYTS